MNEVRATELDLEERQEKEKLSAWIKKHKVQLMLAGISVTTIAATLVGIKNKEAISSLWESLKKEIEKGALYSTKWFEKASVEELSEAREVIQKDYMNPKLDIDYRNECLNLMKRFDKFISEKKWAGQEIGFPEHREHGWYLPNKD